MSVLRQAFIDQLQLKGMKPRTIVNYVHGVKQLSLFINRSPLEASKEDIQRHLLFLIREKKLEPSTVNGRIDSLKTFFKLMQPGSVVMDSFSHMKVPQCLPLVLSRQEVERLISVIDNPKHKAAVMILYCGGLRLEECVTLRPCHIEKDRMMIRVEQGKGSKDRYTLLSKRALVQLRDYYRAIRPKNWLFEGRNGNHLSARMLERVVADAARKAKLGKDVHPHTLRHCFATHLLEAGVPLQLIQKFLGHENIKTTTIYTHITKAIIDKVKSPLDMDIDSDEEVANG